MSAQEIADLIEWNRNLAEWEREHGSIDNAEMHEATVAALSAVPVEGDRLSMEVIEEYRRIVAWLAAKAAVLAPAGDTMHGLAVEALSRLLDREYVLHRIPLYAMLDIWSALYGTSHPEFDEFYAEHGYAETWARLCAAVRSPLPVEGEVEDHEPCDAELWSWDYFKHQQVDAYWMRCHELGEHDEHKNSETGAHWPVQEVAP